MAGPGHSVLQVPVSALEDVVCERHAHYDAAYVSADPAFTHAHITALGPWLAEPTAADLATVAAIAAETRGFDLVLDDVEAFAGGIVHLRPRDPTPFLELTARLLAAYPECPPYAGEFGVIPHLTLDALGPDVTVESTRARLAGRLPVHTRATGLDVAWWEAGACRLLAALPFGA